MAQIFAVYLVATASAALPLGQRMMGTVPRVTQTEKRLSTICERISSIPESVTEGVFSAWYDSEELSWCRSTNISFSRQMKLTYWSNSFWT